MILLIRMAIAEVAQTLKEVKSIQKSVSRLHTTIECAGYKTHSQTIFILYFI